MFYILLILLVCIILALVWQGRLHQEYSSLVTATTTITTTRETTPPSIVRREATTKSTALSLSPWQTTCTSDTCLQELSKTLSLARSWSSLPVSIPGTTRRTSLSLPSLCQRNSTNNTTIVFIKVPKAASSTMTGMLMRWMSSVASSSTSSTTCHLNWHHQSAYEKIQTVVKTSSSSSSQSHRSTSITATSSTNNNNNNSSSSTQLVLLIAPLRAPAARAMSSIYYHSVSLHRKRQASNQYVIQQLQHVGNYQCQYLAPVYRKQTRALFLDQEEEENKTKEETTMLSSLSLYNNYTLTDWIPIVHDIVTTYDFIFVTERWVESVVAFSIIFNIPLTHLLTASFSKQSNSGGGMHHHDNNKTTTTSWYFNGQQCLPLIAPIWTESIQSHVSSSDWLDRTVGDRLLYHVVQASLDATIQVIGAHEMETKIRYYHWLQDRVTLHCAKEIITPCSPNGTAQVEMSRNHCYQRDFGCGYPCIDRLIQQGILQ